MFCGNSDVLCPNLLWPFPINMNVIRCQGDFEVTGLCPVPDRPDKRGMSVINMQRTASRLGEKKKLRNGPGASEGILVWYGQPSEVQFTRAGVVADAKFLEN